MKVLVVFIVCLIAIGIVYVITRREDTNVKYDVYEMLEENSKNSNIYLERVNQTNEVDMVFYKKDNMVKKVGYGEDKAIIIYDTDTRRLTTYNSDTKVGIVFDVKENDVLDSADYCSLYKEILDNKDIYEYKIKKDKIDGKDCIKVVFYRVGVNGDRNRDFIIWIELENNLIVKTQLYSSNFEKSTYHYKNISIGSVTDEDFTIPSDVEIREREIDLK